MVLAEIKNILIDPATVWLIAALFATVAGGLVKRKIDADKLMPIVSFILSLILKAEAVHGDGNGEVKLDYVVDNALKTLPKEDVKKVTEKYGTLSKAVQFVFDKVGSPLIDKGLSKLFKK